MMELRQALSFTPATPEVVPAAVPAPAHAGADATQLPEIIAQHTQRIRELEGEVIEAYSDITQIRQELMHVQDSLLAAGDKVSSFGSGAATDKLWNCQASQVVSCACCCFCMAKQITIVSQSLACTTSLVYMGQSADLHASCTVAESQAVRSWQMLDMQQAATPSCWTQVCRGCQVVRSSFSLHCRWSSRWQQECWSRWKQGYRSRLVSRLGRRSVTCKTCRHTYHHAPV